MNKPTHRRVAVCSGHGLKTKAMDVYLREETDSYISHLEAELREVRADLAREMTSHKDSRAREDSMALSLRDLAQSNFRLAAELDAERLKNKSGPNIYAKPSRADLRDLVDNVWNYVTESSEVPCTSTADKLINEVFGEDLDREGCREDMFIEDEDGNPEGFIKWYERHFGAQPYKGGSHVADCENAWRGALFQLLESKNA